MPAYNDRFFSPAAPVTHVKLCSSAGQSQSDIPMLIDSGADVTLVPKSAVDALGLQRSDTKCELAAFDGATSVSDVVHAELVFLRRIFRGRFLIVDQEVGWNLRSRHPESSLRAPRRTKPSVGRAKVC